MPENKSKHDGMIRGFCHLKEAWYAEANLINRFDGLVDEINIGFYGPTGDAATTGEFKIRWKVLGGHLVPQLCVFDDAWEALSHFSDLLEAMAKLKTKNPTATDLCKILKRLGIKNLTPRNKTKRPRRHIEHIDRDLLNNDPANLRIVEVSENRR